MLLLAAAKQEKFAPLFVIMLLYSFCYAATMPLVNSLMFYQLGKVLPAQSVGPESVKVFFWGPVAWAVVGYFLTGWRAIFKTEGRGRDCLLLAAVLSVIMGVFCLWLPATPPSGTGEVSLAQAGSMLAKPDFLSFLLISLVIAGLIQFYFLGTGRFMQDMGISGKVISGAMAIAQLAQTAATWFLLGLCIRDLGYKWTLVIGAASWVVLYVVYIVGRPPWLIVVSQSFHGLAYVLFIIAGQLYANSVAPENIRASVQAMVFAATVGIGLFLGTQAAGRVMDHFSDQGKFHWRPIWLVPCVVMLAGIGALVALFHG